MSLEGQVGHYRILGKLGAGGMGEVYRAEDTRLGRAVALKVLPAALADDPDRVSRFKREAQLLAALQHPRIAAIHGLEEIDGRRLLALELVEGEDLSERLRRGPLEATQVLELGRQVAEALEAAHEKGIVHRDLKPANLKLTPEGGIKVLDFGLAKALTQETSDGVPVGISITPTLTRDGTQAGVILGTAPYMSPEQARGRPVDRRADIWAFGCVLYEMLTGKRAFDGETTTDILASVVKEDPDWKALPADLPPALPLLVRRCLVKDPRRRLQAIGEARVALETGEDVGLTAALSFMGPGLQPTSGAEQRSLTQRTGWLPWFVLALTVMMASVVAIVALNIAAETAPARPKRELPRRFEIVVSPEEPPLRSKGASVVISPGGERLAWVAEQEGVSQLFVRELNSARPRLLPGTEGAFAPAFSADGEWIAFFDGAHLKKVNVFTGGPLTLAPAPDGHGVSWSREGRLVFAPTGSGGLAVVDTSGGPPAPLTRLGEDEGEVEGSDRWPEVLPNGEWVVFSSLEGGDASASSIEAVSLDTGERHLLHRGGRFARYADGHLLFVWEGTLFSVRLSGDEPAFGGEPQPILEGLDSRETGDGSAEVSAAAGLLVYRTAALADAGRAFVVLDFDPGESLGTPR